MTTLGALALGLGAPAGYAVLHGGLTRFSFTRGFPTQKTAFICCSFGVVFEMAAWLFFLGTDAANFWFAGIISVATAHVYFHFFNMSETARRIRHLVARHHGVAPVAESGSARKAVLRLNRLEALGEIERFGRGFRSRHGLLTWVARLMVLYESWLFPERLTPRRESPLKRDGLGKGLSPPPLPQPR